MQIDMPSLRERESDILLLADHYIKNFCEKHGYESKELSLEVRKTLLEYSWHGNIRELKNICEKAVISSNKRLLITACDFPAYIFHSGGTSHANDKKVQEFIRYFFNEKKYKWVGLRRFAIKEILKKTGGNKAEASRILGISRGTLSKEIKKIK
jgi:DNA-binding NtrC family response regulator